MKYRILILLAFLVLKLQGQNIVEIKPEAIKIANQNFNIEEVIDSRVDTTLVGIFEAGIAGEKKERAELKRGLSITLMSFLDNSLSKINTKNSVVVQINKFAIHQYSGYAEVSYSLSKAKRQFALLEAHLSFYLKHDNQLIKLLEKDYAYEEKGLGIGNKHSKNVHRLFLESLTDLSKIDFNTQDNTVFTWDEVNARKPFYSVMRATQLKKGIYKNFDQFRNNEPSIQNIEIINNSSDSTFQLVYTAKSDGLRHDITADTKIWGFCDGQNAYIKQKCYYFDLAITGQEVTFTGFDYFALRKKNMIGPVLKAAVIDGLIGGFLLDNTSNLLSSLLLSSASKASRSVIGKTMINEIALKTEKKARNNIHVFNIYMDNGEFIQQN